MTAYIVDTHKVMIENTYPDSSYASFAMSDNYAWEPDNRYKMFHNDEALYKYFEEKFCEGAETLSDIKHTMFKKWIATY